MPTDNYNNRSVVVRVPNFGIARGQDGLSAYEQAVAGGYEGTEAQFNQELSSFKTLHDETVTNAAAAAQSSTGAGQSATAAERSAENAASSASSSASSASSASASAGSAADSASSAASSAASAAASAASAGNSASTATEKASEALASATAASASETNAASSEDAAADSAAAAAASAAAIEEYEHDAEAWAIGKRGGQDVPSTDEAYHNNAKYYAEQAGTSAGNAASSASAASASESNAAASASSAAGSASSATTSAATATEKAGEASASASAASTSAASAAGSATNAASSATAASASATAAGNAQTAAETAQGKAEDAQEAAEQAQSDAEAAAQSVSQSAAQISQNTSDISDLKSAINVLEPAATGADVGKVLKLKSVSGGKATEYEYGEGTQPVTVAVEYSDSDLDQYISVDSANGGNQYCVVIASNVSGDYYLKSAKVKAPTGTPVKFSVFSISNYYPQDALNRKKFTKEYDIMTVNADDANIAEIEFGVPLLLSTDKKVLVAACNTNVLFYSSYKDAQHTIFNYGYNWFTLQPGEYNPNAYVYQTSAYSPYYDIKYILVENARTVTKTPSELLQNEQYFSPYDTQLDDTSDNAVQNKALYPYLIKNTGYMVNDAETTYLSGGKYNVDGMEQCYAISCDAPTYGHYTVSNVKVRAADGENITFGLWSFRMINAGQGYWTLERVLGVVEASGTTAILSLETPIEVDGGTERIVAVCQNKKIAYRNASFTPNPYKRPRVEAALFWYNDNMFSTAQQGVEINYLFSIRTYKGWDYTGDVISPVGAYEITYTPTVPETITTEKKTADYTEDIEAPIGSLRGKVWYCAGDSTTYGIEDGVSYADIIGERNSMELWKDGISGTVMTSANDSKLYSAFSFDRYLNIPASVDFVTIWFGINDATMGYPVGTVDSDDPSTFCGAYNKVLSWIINNRPNARIGLVVTHRASAEIKQAIRDIAKKYGLLTFDLSVDPQIPFWHPTDSYYANDVADAVKTLRISQWWYESNNCVHPILNGYKAISYPFERWLRSL